MSFDIDDAFVKQYEREVHMAYQRQGSKLRNTIRTKNGIIGASTTFQKVGKGVASTKTRHGDVPLMNADHTPVECVLSDHYAGDYIDRLDELKIQHSEREVVAQSGAWALGRKTDDLIIAAMAGTTTTVGDYSTGLTRKLILEALEKLNAADVPNDGRRFCAVSPHAWGELLSINEFKDADFIGGDALPWKTGVMAKSWLNITFFVHSGLPLANPDDRDCYMWHMSAVGHAIGMDVTADMQWVAPKAAHFVNHMMSQGACLIDTIGVVEIRVDDDAAYS